MRTVLLVDDSPVVRRVLARRLAAEGFDVREASTAAGARAVAGDDLTCAIVDLELADGDGTAVARALLAASPSLPVAFFTAGASPLLLAGAGALGPVFTKPDVDPVVAWVKRT